MTLKPHQYNCTAVIPHRGSYDQLELCIQGLKWQDDPPFVIVADVPCNGDILDQQYVTDMGAGACIHMPENIYQLGAQSMAACLDAATACVQTATVFYTHSDVFLKRKNLLSWMQKICNKGRPVVGYETFDRTQYTPAWRGMVGNICTMIDMSIYWLGNLNWNFTRYANMSGLPYNEIGPWPDLETPINMQLRALGIAPYLIGEEKFDHNYEDDNLWHLRGGSNRMDREDHKEHNALSREIMRQARMLYDGIKHKGYEP